MYLHKKLNLKVIYDLNIMLVCLIMKLDFVFNFTSLKTQDKSHINLAMNVLQATQ